MTADKIERPKCPGCGKPMLPSFCIMYKEYVCIPCGKAAEFFNGFDKIETTQKEEDEMYKKYGDDIQRLAYINGGASCGKCNKKGGNNCKSCKITDDLKYWGKNG